MRILVTGATGYIGGAVALALVRAGHQVSGLARSTAAAARLEAAGVHPSPGDFKEPSGLAKVVAEVDTVVSTASTGSVDATPQAFADDRVAIGAMLQAVAGTGKTVVFTSGSAVVGVLGRGELTDMICAEDVGLPLPERVFAPAAASIPPMLVAGLGAAMAARVQTEQDVLTAPGVRGVVIRPSLVYGHGGSYDIPSLIRMARAHGCAPHLGTGELRQAFIHIDDLADLYVRAIESGEPGAVYHGEAGEVRMGELARAVSQLIGAGEQTAALSLEEMFGLGGAAAISLSLNKRMSSAKTRRDLRWAPNRVDILDDVRRGSYAAAA